MSEFVLSIATTPAVNEYESGVTEAVTRFGARGPFTVNDPFKESDELKLQFKRHAPELSPAGGVESTKVSKFGPVKEYS